MMKNISREYGNRVEKLDPIIYTKKIQVEVLLDRGFTIRTSRVQFSDDVQLRMGTLHMSESKSHRKEGGNS